MSETTELAKAPPHPIEMGHAGVELSTIEDAFRFAKCVLDSGMAPKGYNNPQAVLVAIQHGAEIGLRPIQALHSIAVINGRATVWGDALPGLLWGSGLLEDMQETCDGKTATCVLKRKGAATPITRTFSIEDAKQAGLLGKQGPWTQYPRRMLQMRARSWAARDGFADVLRGLQVREEVADYREPREPERVDTSEPPRLSLLERKEPEPEVVEAESESVLPSGTEDMDAWLQLAMDDAKSAQSLEVLEGLYGELDAFVEAGTVTTEQAKAIKHVGGMTAKRLREKSGELFQ